MKAFGDHFITANTDKAGIRIAFPERPDQPGTEDIPDASPAIMAMVNLRELTMSACACVTGSLLPDQRMMPRSAPRSESISGRTSGTSAKLLSSSSSACSVVRP